MIVFLLLIGFVAAAPPFCGPLSFNTPSQWTQSLGSTYNSTVGIGTNVSFDVVQLSASDSPFATSMVYYGESFDGTTTSWELSFDFILTDAVGEQTTALPWVCGAAAAAFHSPTSVSTGRLTV